MKRLGIPQKQRALGRGHTPAALAEQRSEPTPSTLVNEMRDFAVMGARVRACGRHELVV
jgi:hypothetical protein